MFKEKSVGIAAVFAMAIAISVVAVPEASADNDTLKGALIGAGVGGLIGGKEGAVVGGVGGAIIGANK